MFITAHPSSELMQVGQAIIFRLVDEDGVDVGNVQAAFDNRGRHQNVGFAADKFHHRSFELMLVHLPVADDDARFWHDLMKLAGDFADVIDPIVDEVDLAFASSTAKARSTSSTIGSITSAKSTWPSRLSSRRIAW